MTGSALDLAVVILAGALIVDVAVELLAPDQAMTTWPTLTNTDQRRIYPNQAADSLHERPAHKSQAQPDASSHQQ